MSKRKQSPTQEKILEQILAKLTEDAFPKLSRAVIYFSAVATVYIIFGEDIATISALSPILGNLVDKIGGDALASILEKVATGDEQTNVEQLIEEQLSDLNLNEVLTEREFYQTIRRLQSQNEDKYQRLSQSVLTVLDSLRRLHPADPAPLSPIPRSSRPLLVSSPLIGRERDSAWLRETDGDKLLIGQPGMGKTFLLYRLALEKRGFFVLSKHRGEIASALRQEKPGILIVDDAHIPTEQELILNLRHLRQEINLDFTILASSWPGSSDCVAEALSLSESRIHKLDRLNPDQIVEVIKIAGIKGPNFIIHEIQEQADGRPGLAVTLTQIYKQGGGGDVWKGDILKRTLLSLESLKGQKIHTIIGAFSLGGEEGMPCKAVSDELDISILDLSQYLTNLAAAGIIEPKTKSGYISIQPPALRHAIVRDVFFPQPIGLWDIQLFLRHAPSVEETALTLIGAQARGANIPAQLLVSQIEKANSRSAWMDYAALGPQQRDWTLQHHRDEVVSLSPASLQLVPEAVIPLMLTEAIGDSRPLYATPSHPMRMIQDWAQSTYLGQMKIIEKRELLLHETLEWLGNDGDPAVGLRALQIVMTPVYHTVEPDPGSRARAIVTRGLITYNDLQDLKRLWPSVYEILRNIQITDYQPICDMIFEWAYPHTVATWGNSIPKKIAQFMRSFIVKMLQDVVNFSEDHLCLLRWSWEQAQELNLSIEIPTERDFMLLYPVVSVDDRINGLKDQLNAVKELAEDWSRLPPAIVAEKLKRFEREAILLNSEAPRLTAFSPRLTPHLCAALAEKIENPYEWVEAFRRAKLSSDLFSPFYRKHLDSTDDFSI